VAPILLASVALATPWAAAGEPIVSAAPPAPAWSARAPGTPTILYVNFDGAVLQRGCGNDPRYGCSTLAYLFDGYVGPFTGNVDQTAAIIQATRTGVADFGVTVVTDRPPDDVEYSMVVYGDIGIQTFAGVAPYIDCEDRWGPDVSFSGPHATSNTGSTIILHEAAHTWGLEHVDAESDILNPYKTSGKKQYFEDACYQIVANTELEPALGSCNEVHTRFCPLPGFQNSWREMMYLFGPPVPDNETPSIEILWPLEGSYHFETAEIPVIVELDDDRHPQHYGVELTIVTLEDTRLENDYVGIDHVTTVGNLAGLPTATHEISVRIVDESGNEAEDGVAFTVLPEGSELPGEQVSEDPDGGGNPSGCRVPARSAGIPALVVLAGLLGRRRRVVV
jgi:hypothetical protein